VADKTGRHNGNRHIKQSCSLPDPYPKPKVMRPNFYYATLLLEDYAGSVSELTAITQYMNHYFMLKDEYEELAELEKCIAIIEMHHLELLAETILLLGVEPKYRTITNKSSVYWDGSYVSYNTEFYDRLAADIAAEKQAIKQYQIHQYLINDIHIKRILERIIEDEEHHLELLNQAASCYCPDLYRKIEKDSEPEE
jgi:bacterioferritin